MRHFAFIVIALAFSHFFSNAQDYKAYLSADPDRVAAIHHAYEYIEKEHAPAPKGYKPFYISHYGRHGSRYHSKESYLTKPIGALEELNNKGFLNSKGKELLDALKGILDESKGSSDNASLYGFIFILDDGRAASSTPSLYIADILSVAAAPIRSSSNEFAITTALGYTLVR